jgi:peptide/nickel transport system permease protein
MMQGVLVALTIPTVIFVILVSMPGDLSMKVAMARYGEDGLNRERIELVRQETGLNGSKIALYGSWMRSVFRMDLGYSLVTGEPVLGSILFHLRMSVLLGIAAMAVSAAMAFPLGIWSGLRPGSAIDFVTIVFSSICVSLPGFVLGAIFIIIFSIHLKWLPAAGFFTAKSIILPALTLGISLAAISSRVIRTAVIGVRDSSFLQFARFKGLNGIRIFFDHGLRNGAVPVVTFLALQLAHLFDGVVVIENLFNWPGIGVLLLESIEGRDLSMIQGLVMVIGFLYAGMNLLADLLCSWLDPRQLLDSGTGL